MMERRRRWRLYDELPAAQLSCGGGLMVMRW